MRVLLDENLPHDLILELEGLDIVTVQGLVVVRGRSNRVQDLRPLVGAIREALSRIDQATLNGLVPDRSWRSLLNRRADSDP